MVDEDRPESRYTDEMQQNTNTNYYEIIFMIILYIFKFQIKISYNVGRWEYHTVLVVYYTQYSLRLQG